MRGFSRIVLAVVLLTCVSTAFASAQAPTTTTTETKKFEVIAVDGNQLVVKLPEGTRELTVPPGFMFTVDGKQLPVSELKPGMAGTATVTTKTTMKPVTVTEVKNGEVMQVTGSMIMVKTDEGFKNFTEGELDKRGVRIMKDGKPVSVTDLHKGDMLSAVIITHKPPQKLTEQQVQATLAKAEAKGAPAGTTGAAPTEAKAPAKKQTAAPAAGEPAGAPAAKKLPKTAGPFPLVGLVGIGSLLTGIGLTIRRRRSR